MRTLESSRLLLRPLDETDEALYGAIYTDADLMRHVGPPLDIGSLQRSFAAACRGMSQVPVRALFWVMRERATDADIGLVALMWREAGKAAEIGAMVLAKAHRLGYAQEAMSTVIDHAFNHLEVSSLWGHHPSANTASIGLMDGLGFVRTPATHPNLDYRWELPRSRWAELRRE
ncbi:GNAT family N-acetyltransferase [Lysobacter fragariae]